MLYDLLDRKLRGKMCGLRQSAKRPGWNDKLMSNDPIEWGGVPKVEKKLRTRTKFL